MSDMILQIPFTWAERRAIFLDRFFYLPFLETGSASPIRLSWKELFYNQHPVIVEYCSGNGQWIGSKAKEHPEINWVAVEKKFERAQKIWALLKRENLSNLYVLCGEAETLTRDYMLPETLSAVYVNFPDPWPKRKQSKHRLVSHSFLDALEAVLLPQKEAIFATDDRLYIQHIVSLFHERDGWQPLFSFPYFTTDWPTFGTSFFQDLFERKGRAPHYTRWKWQPR